MSLVRFELHRLIEMDPRAVGFSPAMVADVIAEGAIKVAQRGRKSRVALLSGATHSRLAHALAKECQEEENRLGSYNGPFKLHTTAGTLSVQLDQWFGLSPFLCLLGRFTDEPTETIGRWSSSGSLS